MRFNVDVSNRYSHTYTITLFLACQNLPPFFSVLLNGAQKKPSNTKKEDNCCNMLTDGLTVQRLYLCNPVQMKDVPLCSRAVKIEAHTKPVLDPRLFYLARPSPVLGHPY